MDGTSDLTVGLNFPVPVSFSDIARDAYDNAVKLFKETLTEDECKRIWLQDKTDMQQVQEAVLVAKSKYDNRSQPCKARKWLTKLSQRIIYYGKVFDTIANYHPEYVALPWGAIKFLLIAVINHEELIAQLSKALVQIAAVLPRANAKLLLYPTEQIKYAVSALFAQIIKFIQRATNWYSEGRAKHVITAILRPAPLRFQDLLDEITSCSEAVDQLAVSASQAELRDMHLLLLDFKKVITENQAVNCRLFLESRKRICEIQFSQILTFTSTTSLPHPEETFRQCVFLSKRRQLRSISNSQPSWRSKKLKEWATTNMSALVIIKGSYLTRHETKDFAADMVALLRSMQIPVVWTLSAKAEGNIGWRSPVDVLKQLVLQVLYLNPSLLKDQSPALNAVRFQCSTTESEWFAILASVLNGIHQIYIVVDAEILNTEFSSQISWPDAFHKIFKDLMADSCKTIVKVVLISFGSSPYVSSHQSASFDDVTLRIERDRRMRKHYFRSQRTYQGADVLRPFLRPSSTSIDLG